MREFLLLLLILTSTAFAQDDDFVPEEYPPFYFEGEGISDYYYLQMTAYYSFVTMRIDVVMPSEFYEPQMGPIHAYIFNLNSGYAGEYDFGYSNEFERMYLYGAGDILRIMCRASLTQITSVEAEFDYLEGAYVLNVPATRANECEGGERDYVPILRDWR